MIGYCLFVLIPFLFMPPGASPSPASFTQPPIEDIVNGTPVIGGRARVNTSEGDSLRVRATPGTNAELIGQLQTGTMVTILDGPQQVNDFTWWQVRADTGIEGWAVEGIGEEDAFFKTLIPLCPFTEGRLAYRGLTGAIEELGYANYNLYTSEPDGSNRCNLTQSLLTRYESPDWSPDGARLAFTAAPDSGNFELFVMDADGGNLQQLTDDGAEISWPSWSPVGARIAFMRERPDRIHPQLWVMNADGSNPHPLTSSNAPKGAFRWSPDGAKVAYEELGGREDLLVLVDVNSGAAQVFPSNSRFSGNFAFDWSPDGTHLILALNSLRGTEEGLYLLDLASGNIQAIAITNNANLQFPAWSPDGSHIAYWEQEKIEIVDDMPTDSDFYLTIVGEDGVIHQRLVIEAYGTLLTWSPDSTQIAFSSVDNGVFVFEADGGTLTRIYDLTYLADAVAWQP